MTTLHPGKLILSLGSTLSVALLGLAPAMAVPSEPGAGNFQDPHRDTVRDYSSFLPQQGFSAPTPPSGVVFSTSTFSQSGSMPNIPGFFGGGGGGGGGAPGGSSGGQGNSFGNVGGSGGSGGTFGFSQPFNFIPTGNNQPPGGNSPKQSEGPVVAFALSPSSTDAVSVPDGGATAVLLAIGLLGTRLALCGSLRGARERK